LSPLFSGAAGTALGDFPQVSVALYQGASASGRSLGTLHATRTGSTWSGRWPQPLALGLYTARATESDDAGNTGISVSNTFLVVPSPAGIGPSVTFEGSLAAVPITCTAPAGAVCTGPVLILTKRPYRAVAGGPTGRLRLLFAYVSIPGGKTLIIRHRVSGPVARVLRRYAPLQVTVTALLTQSGGGTQSLFAVRRLRLG
jgi:hypothetical protein